jgi:stage V sporulation protein B
MSTPVKHGAISLGIHLVGLYIMLIVFKWGIYAVVMGNVIFSLSMCILNARALNKTTNYKQEVNRTFIIPLKAATVMGIITFVVNFLIGLVVPNAITTMIALLVAVVSYVVALLKFGALTSDEIVGLPKGAKVYMILRKLHLVADEY